MDIRMAINNNGSYHDEITDAELKHFLMCPEDLVGSPFKYSIEDIKKMYLKRVYPNLTESEKKAIDSYLK